MLLPIAVAIGCGIASIVALRRHQPSRRILKLLYITFMAAALFAPALIASKIVITPEHLEETAGFWPIESSTHLEYRELAFIRPASDVIKGSPRRVWHVQDKHGQWNHIVLSNLWELHEAAIKTCLQQYGVTFRE